MVGKPDEKTDFKQGDQSKKQILIGRPDEKTEFKQGDQMRKNPLDADL